MPDEPDKISGYDPEDRGYVTVEDRGAYVLTREGRTAIGKPTLTDRFLNALDHAGKNLAKSFEELTRPEGQVYPSGRDDFQGSKEHDAYLDELDASYAEHIKGRHDPEPKERPDFSSHIGFVEVSREEFNERMAELKAEREAGGAKYDRALPDVMHEATRELDEQHSRDRFDRAEDDQPRAYTDKASNYFRQLDHERGPTPPNVLQNQRDNEMDREP